MAKKSKMARAGKAAKKAFKEKCRLNEDRQEQMRKAESGPLRLRDVVPPCIKGIDPKHLDDEMATIAELTGEERSFNPQPRLGIAIEPFSFGEKNLRWFQDFWQKQLSETKEQIAKLETMSADAEQLFETRIQETRLQAVIRYLEQLILLSNDRSGMPVLPQCRSWNYFYTGCSVMAFIPARSDILPNYFHRFVFGNITSVAKGKVTVRLNRNVQVYGSANFCQMTYDVDSMRLVRFEDFDSLLCNSYHRGGWLSLSAAYEGNPELAAGMKHAYERKQIDQKVGDYQFVAKMRSERK